MRSILDQHPLDSVSFHVLHDGAVDDATLARLGSVNDGAAATLAIHEVPASELSGLPEIDRFGRVVWLRFMLPSVLEHVERVLYLDADTFIVDSLAPLFETDISNVPLAAVANVIEPGARKHVTALGLDPMNFLNSGVLLMDLAMMREERSTSELFAFVRNATTLLWPDQDALNAVFAGRWRRLHPRYNTMNSFWTWRDWAGEVFGPDLLDEARTNPAILHFEGPSLSKPWHYLCEHPWRESYRRALARTPWSDTPLEETNMWTRVIARLPAGRRLGAYRALHDVRRIADTLFRSSRKTVGFWQR